MKGFIGGSTGFETARCVRDSSPVHPGAAEPYRR